MITDIAAEAVRREPAHHRDGWHIVDMVADVVAATVGKTAVILPTESFSELWDCSHATGITPARRA
jgi:hypothetical protein